MTTEPASFPQVRHLQRVLPLTWGAAWLLGLGILAGVTISLSDEFHESNLDAELELYATATYGLAWFDENGVFHDEVFARETDLVEAPVDIWVVEPGTPPTEHLAPSSAQFQVADLGELAQQVMATQEDLFHDGVDATGQPYRLHAAPTFEDGEEERPRAAILVVADPQPARDAHASFVTGIVTLALLLGAVGIGVGLLLTRWNLKPVLRALHQRERFVAAAAHELRTPVAAMQAVCDSALAQDEPAEAALERIQSLTQRTSQVVDKLLLFARLDAGAVELQREEVRLDLLAEACAPEESPVEFHGEESVARVDARLVEIALRNVIENALRHSPDGQTVIVSVSGARVVVEDRGAGFPEAVRSLAKQPVAIAPSKQGAGIGLAIARMVAELHGGTVRLENRASGGARVEVTLGVSA